MSLLKRICLLFLMYLPPLLLLSCSPTPKEQIVGRWKFLNGGGGVQFLRDGTVVVYGGPVNLSGSYQLREDGKTLETRYKIQDKEIVRVHQIKLEGDSLIMISEKDGSVALKKDQ